MASARWLSFSKPPSIRSKGALLLATAALTAGLAGLTGLTTGPATLLVATGLALTLLASRNWRTRPHTPDAQTPDVPRAGDQPTLPQPAMDRRRLSRALATGEIRAWFQPQIDTTTGQVTGFEALARWLHLDHGIIPPADFLPAVDDEGLGTALTDAILAQSLDALHRWDQAGFIVPDVSVNLGDSDLRNPDLATGIRQHLDRSGIPAHRLRLEVHESVTAAASDCEMTQHMLWQLSDWGCPIDLDDFGMGNGAIACLGRFPTSRLKIDRSVIKDPRTGRRQQRLLAAILAMGNEMGLQSVAEGIENASDIAVLARMGCGYAQGYAIGRPMPLEASLHWLARNQGRTRAGHMPHTGSFAHDAGGVRGKTA
ncbi:MAG: EAL domain-containing protein [Qingshengfaniella sp.]